MKAAKLFDLSGKVAVITGSGKGIGKGIAKLLSESGAKVVLCSRTKEDVEEVAREITGNGGTAFPTLCDVTIDDQLVSLADSAISEFGAIDIWVNNVGGSTGRSSLKELSRSDWDKTIALTLTSVFVGCQVAARNMQSGSIINISSRSSWGAVPHNSHYAAAKAGVNVLTASLAHELGPDIRCNAVASGAVPTDIFFKVMKMQPEDLPQYAKDTGVPLERLGTPKDIAGAVLFLCSEASSWMTGEVITVSGGR